MKKDCADNDNDHDYDDDHDGYDDDDDDVCDDDDDDDDDKEDCSVEDAGSHPERLRMKKDCDEVFPGVLVGSGDTIKNVSRI